MRVATNAHIMEDYGGTATALQLPTASCSAGMMPLNPEAVSAFRFIQPRSP